MIVDCCCFILSIVVPEVGICIGCWSRTSRKEHEVNEVVVDTEILSVVGRQTAKEEDASSCVYLVHRFDVHYPSWVLGVEGVGVLFCHD